MTKTLEQIQKENRKFILEAIHGCSYEEALEKEQGATCEYLYQTEFGVKRIMGDIKNYGYNRKKHFEDAFLIEIIGRPITLDRLLLALPHKQIEIELSWFGDSVIFKYDFFGPRKFFWRLLFSTLEEQTEETQKEINKLSNAVKICQEK